MAGGAEQAGTARAAGPLVGRSRLLERVVGLLGYGFDVDVTGDGGSGRSAMLRRLNVLLEAAGWSALGVRGVAALRSQPFAALHLAGVGAPSDTRGASTLQVTARALRQRLEHPRSVVLVDDADDLDEASWGAIDAVARPAGVPVVRVRRRGAGVDGATGPLGSSSADGVAVVEATALAFEELETVLERGLGGPIDGATMSRLFSKSGGNVGLAISMAELARRDGRIVQTASGPWTAIGDLWTPGLSAMMEARLAGLRPPARDALETIALVGVTDLETLRALAGWDALEELEARSMIALVAAGSRRLVTVSPPLLVEYLRHRPPTLGRARVSELVGDGLGPAETGALVAGQLVGPVPQAADAAVFVRLVKERDRARRIVAGAEWEDEPTVGSALPYLAALLHGDTPRTAIADVIARTDAEHGDPADRARFALLAARWSAFVEGELGAALAGLEVRSAGLGSFAPLLAAEGIALRLQLDGTGLPLECPPELDDDVRAPAEVRAGVLEVRMLFLLARGRFAEAVTAYETLERVDERGSRIHARAYRGLALAALGRSEEAKAHLRRGFDEARGMLDVDALRALGAALVCVLTVEGDYDEVEDLLDLVFAAGDPFPVPPGTMATLLCCAAIVAVRRGAVRAGERHLRELSGLATGDGPLVAQTPALARAQVEAPADPVRAAEQLWLECERAWVRGNRFAACYGFLSALEIHPDGNRLAEAGARVREVGGALLTSRLEYLLALDAQDPERLLAAVGDLERSGLTGLAVAAARRAAILFAEGRDAAGAGRARRLESGILESRYPRQVHAQRFASAALALSEREREVARLAVEGLTNQDIADRLVLSVRTVETHMHHVLRKLELGSRQALKLYADRL